MFVVHQNDDMATKVEDICYGCEWSDVAKRRIDEMRRRIDDHSYYYGNTDKCNAAMKKAIDEYQKLNSEEFSWVIYINGVNYGKFYSESAVCNEYHQLIDALRNKERVYQISRSNAW